MMRRGAFARWPVHGNVLEMLREGRLEIGEHTLLEPGVWLTSPAPGRIEIGAGTFLNLGVMLAALELVAIGDHCMLANGCLVTDAVPLRRPRPPRHLAGVPQPRANEAGRQRVVWRQRRRHKRSDGRRAVRDRGQLGRHA